jgi:NADH dehydrogenase FAD-containing subunit
MMPPAASPQPVIVGGGFGGLYAALALPDQPARVTPLDRRNHHLLQPLLYRVATAVSMVGRLMQSGYPAWLFVHIIFLIGFRNRFLMLFEWAWAYVTWRREARLITGRWKGQG